MIQNETAHATYYRGVIQYCHCYQKDSKKMSSIINVECYIFP